MLEKKEPLEGKRSGAGLMERLGERTRRLHVQAERTGIVRDILRGNASRYGYALLLRNLLAAYQQIEEGLDACSHAPAVGMIARAELFRSEAIESDLHTLCGANWREDLPLLAAGQHYADRIAETATGAGDLLLAHAYVRYLGDLNGGQILQRLLARSLDLTSAALRFYDFPGIADFEQFIAEYRRDFDRAALEIGDVAAVIEEAAEAFRLNIALSEDVQRCARLIENANPAV